jgi:hypothetical protein
VAPCQASSVFSTQRASVDEQPPAGILAMTTPLAEAAAVADAFLDLCEKGKIPEWVGLCFRPCSAGRTPAPFALRVSDYSRQTPQTSGSTCEGYLNCLDDYPSVPIICLTLRVRRLIGSFQGCGARRSVL